MRLFAFVLACLALLATQGSLLGQNPAAALVQVDYQKHYQTMDGLGASSNFYENLTANLPEPARSQMFDLVFDDLGFNILCIRLYPDFQKAAGAAYDWNVMANQRVVLAAAMARGRIDRVWIKVSSPPGWMKDNGSHAGGGNVLPQHYTGYARYLEAYFSGMEKIYGFRLDGLSIFNEPGFGNPTVKYDSTSTTPVAYRDILKVVGAHLARSGLGRVFLMGPETGHITADISGAYAKTGTLEPRYVNAILQDPVALGFLDVISTHQYGDQLIVYGTGPPDDWPRLLADAAKHGLRVWETEMFVGGPKMASGDMAEALRAALLAHTALTQGDVTAWHYWQYCNPDERSQNKAQGVLSLVPPGHKSFKLYPLYYVLKHFGRHVGRGSLRVAASSNHAGLKVVAFTREGLASIIAFNQGTQPIQASFSCTAIAGMVAHVRSSATENYKAQTGITPAGNSFSLLIPPQSISSLSLPLAVVPRVPVARFSAHPRSGLPPLTVQLTDQSLGVPSSWAWDFDGDGQVDSTKQHPQAVYHQAGKYRVSLTVKNALGTDKLLKVDEILVREAGGPIDRNLHTIHNGRAEDPASPWSPFVWDPRTVFTGGAPTGTPLPGGTIVADPTRSQNRVIQLRGNGQHSIVGAGARIRGFRTLGEALSRLDTVRFRVLVPAGSHADFATLMFDLDDNGQARYAEELLGSFHKGLVPGWNEVTFHLGASRKAVGQNDGECLLFFLFRLASPSQVLYLDDLLFLGGSGGATALPFGRGCAGTGGKVPELGGLGLPLLGTAAFSTLLQDARAGAICALGLDVSRIPFTVGPCTLYLPNPPLVVLGQTDAQGKASQSLGTIPNGPILLGLKLQLQYAVDDPRGGWFQSLAFSNGLEARVGY